MSYPKLTPIIAKGATEPRYLEDRFADVVNIKDFGAKGDGETDDIEAITNAITSATSKNTGIFFPSGIYYISEPIDLTKNFYGDGYISDGENSQPVSHLVDIFVSVDGTGSGLSAENPTTLSIAKSILSARKKDGIKIHLAQGTYVLDSTFYFDDCDVSFIGDEDPTTVVLSGSNLSSPNIQCLLFDKSNVYLEGITVSGAINNGIRVRSGSKINAVNCEFNNNSHSGLSVIDNSDFTVSNCNASDNGWCGFAFASASSGIVDHCNASNNQDGFQVNYTGNVYFSYCKAEENTRDGFFISGAASCMIMFCESNNNTVDGVLASGLTRVSIGDSVISGNNRGVYAEYGGDVSIGRSSVLGLKEDNSIGWCGLAAEYGSRITISPGNGTDKVEISHFTNGLWAIFGGFIFLPSPASNVLTLSYCTYNYSPAINTFGNSGSCIFTNTESGLKANLMPSYRGQLNDAVLVGNTDLNTLVDSGVYCTNGSPTNKPSDFGQCLVIVYKRATSDASRKIVQICYDLSSNAQVRRTGNCINGDDTSITWGAWA